MQAGRKLQFQRRRKGLNIDPNAKVINNFFGTVGSPIKMSNFDIMDKRDKKQVSLPNNAPADDAKTKPTIIKQSLPAPTIDSDAPTIDAKMKERLRLELQKQKEREEQERAKKLQQEAEAAAQKEQAAAKDTSALDVATVKHDGRRRERRRSMEMIEPAKQMEQMNLKIAKKAKIPHFMSAWFNADNNEHKENKDNMNGKEPTKPVNPPVQVKDDPNATIVPAPDARAIGATARNYSQSINFSEIQLGRMIGEGAFGKVHEGKWRGKSVAVKLLICQELRSDILHEFQSEVEIMSVLRHPNICRLLGACMEPPHRALVVELLQRGSLWGVLRTHRRQIDQQMRCRFIYDTAKGMSYLHHFERPILHRDLKSPNLLVDKNYNIKISDFGLARVKAHVQTMTGNCGTVQWMAPEVLGNQKYTEKADVFSFGIVIWEIVTGECPYDGMSQIQAALGVLNRNLRPNIPKDCPPFFSRLMKACWNRQPELRPSFPHIVNAFRTYQASISETKATSSAAASANKAIAAS